MASGRTIWKQARRALEDLSLGALVVIVVLLVAAGSQVAAFSGMLLGVIFVPLLLAASIAGPDRAKAAGHRTRWLPLRGRWLRYLVAVLLLILLYAAGIPMLLGFASAPR